MKEAGTVPLLERIILERYWEFDKGFRRFAQRLQREDQLEKKHRGGEEGKPYRDSKI